MDNRTLVKITASESSLSIRTISRRAKSPHNFIILREELELLRSGGFIGSDLHSFVDFRRDKNAGTVRARFCWLSRQGQDGLYGREERLWLPYEALMTFAEQSMLPGGPKRWSVLSMVPHTRVRLIFAEHGNLKTVLQYPWLRKKLVQALRDNFSWYNAEEIRFYNDCDPFSFCFREYRHGCPVLTGGLVLHNRQEPKQAYYSVHT